MLTSLLLVISLSVAAVLGASIIPCPDSCTCRIENEEIHARCTSFDFLQRLQPKQASKLASLDLSGGHVSSLDPKLKYLRNLRRLDVSRNKIRDVSSLPHLPKLEELNASSNRLDEITVEFLPKSLKIIDISHNKITTVPTDWSYLNDLKVINFTGNPLYCSCHTVTLRTNLLESKVNVAEPVFCDKPFELRGKPWTSQSVCSKNLWDVPLGDEPMEGSGSGDIDEKDPSSLEPEYLPENVIKEKTETTIQPEEGSGDDEFYGKPTLTPDDGDEDYYEEDTTTVLPPIDETQIEKDEVFTDNEERPKPCYINCSTPGPVGENDEENASEPPNLFKGFGIIYDDLSGKESEPKPSEKPITTHENSEGVVEFQSTEPPKEGRKLDTSVVEVSKSDSQKELEKIVEEPPQNARTTYIVLSILLIIMILVIVYAIVKSKNRRARNRRRRLQNKDMNKGTELKLLTAPQNQPEKTNSVPERVPLMNGQNGTQNGKTAEEPDAKENSVELRQKKSDSNQLSPEAKRVTIRASEIPDSVPKTPVLVNRHVSSDGNIITTPSVDQRI